VQLKASAPMRIDLAGATLDIWPLYLYHADAQTLNVALTLKARCWLQTRDDRRLVLRSLDTNQRVEVAHRTALPDDASWRLLKRIIEFFEGEGLNIVIQSDSPIGAGIAGSSALNVAVCAAFAKWQGRSLSADTLLDIAMNIEAQVINVPTGAQDYRPAYYGGISAIEMGVGGITRIALDVEASALADRLIVAYSGVSRQSGINNWQVMKRRIDGEPSLIDHFEQICLVARTMRTALVAGDWREVGHQMNREWELRKCLAPGVTTPAIDNLIKKARGVGALGAKVCGAGGGGCIVSLAEPTDVVAVSSALSSCGATILPCDVDTNGLQITLGVAPPE